MNVAGDGRHDDDKVLPVQEQFGRETTLEYSSGGADARTGRDWNGAVVRADVFGNGGDRSHGGDLGIDRRYQNVGDSHGSLDRYRTHVLYGDEGTIK